MSHKHRLLVCTHNPGKIREIRSLLSDLPLEVLTAEDVPDLPEPVEDAKTFVENARIKARSAFEHTGMWTLADDSGLVVPALGGDPGVDSAYYAGHHPDRVERERANRHKLSQTIQSIPNEQRDAYFVCTLVFLWDGGEQVFEGRCEGQIITEERGQHGFGFDPLFLIPSLGKTLAELEPEEKNSRSHRANALKAFRAWLPAWLETSASS
ncbi:MAG: RdgB/HAM1 family non-canonical purine NTP pyrophosphatase [Myxococcales bacterium]|nr:RdgB/HAM1 family non-canonical purine NTP pyrophosphatase [Myxococcales bacterium]